MDRDEIHDECDCCSEHSRHEREDVIGDVIGEACMSQPGPKTGREACLIGLSP